MGQLITVQGDPIGCATIGTITYTIRYTSPSPDGGIVERRPQGLTLGAKTVLDEWAAIASTAVQSWALTSRARSGRPGMGRPLPPSVVSPGSWRFRWPMSLGPASCASVHHGWPAGTGEIPG